MKLYCTEMATTVFDCPNERETHNWFTNRREAEARARERVSDLCDIEQSDIYGVSDDNALAQVWLCHIPPMSPKRLAVHMTRIAMVPENYGVVVAKFKAKGR